MVKKQNVMIIVIKTKGKSSKNSKNKSNNGAFASAKVKENTRQMNICRNTLLKNRTVPEKIFANKLRSFGFKFEEQKGFLREKSFYVADFYIPCLNTIVEIDGGYHNRPDQVYKDLEKDYFYRQNGMKVIRIKNKDVSTYTLEDLTTNVYVSLPKKP